MPRIHKVRRVTAVVINLPSLFVSGILLVVLSTANYCRSSLMATRARGVHSRQGPSSTRTQPSLTNQLRPVSLQALHDSSTTARSGIVAILDFRSILIDGLKPGNARCAWTSHDEHPRLCLRKEQRDLLCSLKMAERPNKTFVKAIAAGCHLVEGAVRLCGRPPPRAYPAACSQAARQCRTAPDCIHRASTRPASCPRQSPLAWSA